MNAYAIIMAGGNGERFWPLSTPERPKQFLDLFGDCTLLRRAVDSLQNLIPVENIYVMTADRFVDLTRETLPVLPVENIIGEPCRRDTAAVVAAACGLVLKKGGEKAVGCVLSADALISPLATFRRQLEDAIQMAANSDSIVTMGIRPSRPETRFGYISCGDVLNVPNATRAESTVFYAVSRFVEKPNLETAKGYLAAGNFLWNAGIFIWKAAVMRDAYRKFAPDIYPLIDVLSRSDRAKEALDGLYPSIRSISVDFAVMEHAENIVVAKASFDWDDVGAWTSVENHFAADEQGNVVLGPCRLQNCHRVTVVNRSEDESILAVAGLEDAVVVRTQSATLVCSKAESNNLKTLVRGLV